MADDPHLTVERLNEIIEQRLLLTEQEYGHLVSCHDCRQLLVEALPLIEPGEDEDLTPES